MSKSAKNSPTSRFRTAQSALSTSVRKPARSIIKDIQPDAGASQTQRQHTAEKKMAPATRRIVPKRLLASSQWPRDLSASSLFLDETLEFKNCTY